MTKIFSLHPQEIGLLLDRYRWIIWATRKTSRDSILIARDRIESLAKEQLKLGRLPDLDIIEIVWLIADSEELRYLLVLRKSLSQMIERIHSEARRINTGGPLYDHGIGPSLAAIIY